MKITNPITLDVARSNSYICLLGKQFDSNSRYLQVTLTNNGQPLPIPSGAGVVLRATRADGAGSMTAGTVNGDGTALVEIDETVLEVAGAASLSIEVTSGGQVLTSASCNLTVQKADASGWVKVYVAAASVSAGTYHISLAGQSYSFTTTQTIPAGGAIYFNSDGGTAQTRDASGNVLDASLTLTAGTSGTELTSDVPTMTFLAALAQQVGELADTDNLVAGSAEALLGGGTAENVAVALRGNAGNAREKIGKLVGGTIAWNQLCKELNATNWITSDGSITSGEAYIQPTSTWKGIGTSYDPGIVVGHKYFVAVQGKLAASGTNITVGSNRFGTVNVGTITSTTYQVFAGIFAQASADAYTNFSLSNRTGVANFYLKEPMLTDLTVALGPTIADYVYTLESGTAGAGVAWLARYFPKILGGYYAYAAPALQSVNVEGKKISGFNLWDETWRFDAGQIKALNLIPVLPNETYYFKCPVALFSSYKYDAAGQSLGAMAIGNNSTFTTDAQTHFIWFSVDGSVYGSTYKGDICINLSNSLLNGQYFPHREFYYPIQSGELRGVPKLDANNNLTFDGDWQEPDGTRTRRYGAVDLGTINYSYESSYSRFSPGLGVVSNIKIPAATDTPNARIIPFKVVTTNEGWAGRGGSENLFCIDPTGYLRFYTTQYSSAAAFKTAMSGVYFVYELDTPYTEAGQPFATVERLDNGIEEVVDAGVEAGTRDVVVPVGQDATIYRDLAALLGAIPNPPTSAGTYTLRATVTTTNATFSWS